MPRADEPRVTVRLGEQEGLVLQTAAEAANVAVGALVRECVRRSAVQVAREVSEGRLKLRARPASVPVSAPAAPEPVTFVKSQSVSGTAAAASQALAQSRGAGVKTAREIAMERQRRINERKP